MSGSNNNSQGTIKLRDSCELCAAAKVKCNKDKPVCSRCLKRGLRCKYGASRRQGRPAQNSESHTQNPTNYDNGNSLHEAVTAFPDTVTPDEWLTSMNYTLSNHGQSLPISLDGGFDMDNLFTDGDVTKGSDCLQPERDGMHCDPESCCMSIALDLLRRSSITDALEACPRRRNQVKDSQPPSLERVVSTNMYNIESISTLLDCRCALNENLLHTIWLIILNIIKWYARAVSGTARPVPSNDAGSATSVAPFSLKDLLGSPPTGLDGFMTSVGGPADGQAQAAAQTLLDDLYRIQDIVNRFAQRIAAARLRDESSKLLSTCQQTGVVKQWDIQAAISTTSWFLSQASSNKIEADLRGRLRAVTLEVVQILVRG